MNVYNYKKHGTVLICWYIQKQNAGWKASKQIDDGKDLMMTPDWIYGFGYIYKHSMIKTIIKSINSQIYMSVAVSCVFMCICVGGIEREHL